MKKILFVCTGNTCRSVMAEKIFNNLAKKKKLKFKAESAGIYANEGSDVTQNTIKALKKLGIRNIKHKSIQFCLDNLFNYDYCVALTSDIKNYIGKFENVFCFQDFIAGSTDVSDPYMKDESEYLLTANQIKEYVEKFIDVIGEEK